MRRTQREQQDAAQLYAWLDQRAAEILATLPRIPVAGLGYGTMEALASVEGLGLGTLEAVAAERAP